MNKTLDKIKNIAKSLKSLTIMGFADILTKGLTALFWFYMARQLNVENYGEINYLLTIGGIASTFSLVGSIDTMTVYTAKNVKIQSSLSAITITFSAISAVALYFIFHNIGLSLFVPGYVISRMAVTHMLGKKMYMSWSYYLIAQTILMISLSFSFFKMIGPDGILLGIASSWFLYSVKIFKAFRESKINLSIIKERSGFLINNYILDLSTTFSGSLDRLLIAPILGFMLLGNYALSLQFLSILTALPAIVYRYVLPQDASGISTIKLKKGVIFLSVVISLVGIFLVPSLIPIFFSKYSNAVELIQILSLSIVPTTITSMLNSKLLGSEKSGKVLAGSAIFLVTVIIGILSLGTFFGVTGVAFSMVISAYIQTCYVYLLNKKRNQTKN